METSRLSSKLQEQEVFKILKFTLWLDAGRIIHAIWNYYLNTYQGLSNDLASSKRLFMNRFMACLASSMPVARSIWSGLQKESIHTFLLVVIIIIHNANFTNQHPRIKLTCIHFEPILLYRFCWSKRLLDEQTLILSSSLTNQFTFNSLALF